VEEALANGAAGYLMKPFTASILVDAIANLDPHA
jgi:DNA-binding NarL/FixJ family response regulator